MRKNLPAQAAVLLITAAILVSFIGVNENRNEQKIKKESIRSTAENAAVIDRNIDLHADQDDKSAAANIEDTFKDPESITPVVLQKDNPNSALWKKAVMGLVSQRKLTIKGGKEHPDLFREWQVGIRTKEGEKGPAYRYNYQMKELSKTRNIKSLAKPSNVQQLTWVERGPGNVSGRTRGIIVDPDDPTKETWFAGSVSGGIWKTTNSGESWTNLTPDLPNLATSTLAMAESNHDIIYAGTGEGFFNVDQVDGSGIWKSTDKGVTWNVLPSTIYRNDFENVTRIVVDPDNENIVLASAAPGFNYQNFFGQAPSSKIFRSTNGGTSWESVLDAGLFSIEQIVPNPQNFNTLYATINGIGVFKSLDGGLTWNNSSNGIGEVLRMELAVAPSDTSTLYFSAEGGESGSVLYASDDAGANWTPMADTSGVDYPWLGSQGWYDNTIAVDPYDKNKIYVGGINLWRLDRVAGSDTSEEQVTGVDFENTSSFFSLVNWGGPYAGGGIGTGDDFLGSAEVTEDDFVSVEIRFGPGMTQKAHRFVSIGGNFEYQDYIDVPFEVWDIDNNIQLMVSFRDWINNGVFDLIEFDAGNIQREYLGIQAVPYNDSAPDTNIAQFWGFLYKNIYSIWPILADGATWDPDNLPSSVVRINWGTFITFRLTANVVTDGYGQYGGATKGVHVDHHNILLIPTNIELQQFRLVNGNDGGVSFSDDKGATFIQPRNGYNTTQFYGIDKMNGGDRYIGGTQDNGTFISPEDPGITSEWVEAPSGDGFEAVWHYNNPDLILESSQFNNIYKSTDRGITWNPAGAANGLSDQGGATSPFITKLAKSKQDPDLVFAVGASGVWRTDDFADSWTLTPMPAEFNGVSSFSDVKISLINPQIVWAGQGMTETSRLYVSTDGGLSFDTTVNYTDVGLGRITALETDPVEENTAYALFSFARTSKILKTTDLGQTWEDISGFGADTVSSAGFPDVAVFCLLVMPYNTDVIWAGTEIGIFQTTDGGENWTLMGDGLPPVAVHELVIVNDEVVAATHGRGVWTVSVPELLGYEPAAPEALSPRLSPIAQNPSGLLVIPFALRSAYDSSHVLINNEVLYKIAETDAAVDTIVYHPVTQTRTDSVQVIGYKNGRQYKSYLRTSEDKVLGAPVSVYANNFDEETDDFAGTGFTISQQVGFDNEAIHSPHPYDNNTNDTYQLLIPIIVGPGGSVVTYRDVALIEPGDPGSVFGDENFWDYVVVEGTKDGITWSPLADGYDAREDSVWLEAFFADSLGDSTMYSPRSIEITDIFEPGDTILIRFRLFADGAVTGWGWAIDNLTIEAITVGTTNQPKIPTTFSLSQNYPNPFNPTTIIKYQLPQQERVTLEIFNTLGQKVKTLVNDIKTPGYYQVMWDGTNSNNSVVATGVYIYRLTAGNFVVSKKMMFLK